MTHWKKLSLSERKAAFPSLTREETKRLTAILRKHSAFNSTAELRRDMIDHGYLPTAFWEIREFFDEVGFPHRDSPEGPSEATLVLTLDPFCDVIPVSNYSDGEVEYSGSSVVFTSAVSKDGLDPEVLDELASRTFDLEKRGYALVDQKVAEEGPQPFSGHSVSEAKYVVSASWELNRDTSILIEDTRSSELKRIKSSIENRNFKAMKTAIREYGKIMVAGFNKHYPKVRVKIEVQTPPRSYRKG